MSVFGHCLHCHWSIQTGRRCCRSHVANGLGGDLGPGGIPEGEVDESDELLHEPLVSAIDVLCYVEVIFNGEDKDLVNALSFPKVNIGLVRILHIKDLSTLRPCCSWWGRTCFSFSVSSFHCEVNQPLELARSVRIHIVFGWGKILADRCSDLQTATLIVWDN